MQDAADGKVKKSDASEEDDRFDTFDYFETFCKDSQPPYALTPPSLPPAAVAGGSFLRSYDEYDERLQEDAYSKRAGSLHDAQLQEDVYSKRAGKLHDAQLQEDVYLKRAEGLHDAQLQEDVYLRPKKATSPLFRDLPNDPYPEKNTFIHYQVPSSMTQSQIQDQAPSPVWTSAPPITLTTSWHTKQPHMEQTHLRGECKPCGYYFYKVDGCRMGNDCQFCHLCQRGEGKKKKKEKAKARRHQDDVEVEAVAPPRASERTSASERSGHRTQQQGYRPEQQGHRPEQQSYRPGAQQHGLFRFL